MSSPIIKICGLTSRDASELAMTEGASYLGYIFHPKSPRHLTLEKALDVIPTERQAKIVAVTVNMPLPSLEVIVETIKPDVVQCHGQETPSHISEIKNVTGLPVMKAISVSQAEDLDLAETYIDSADMLLFDTKSTDPNIAGGTGIPLDWKLLAKRSFDLPWFLSGGIAADNVARALDVTSAKYVDVSSSLESEAGVKSLDKIRAFMQEAQKVVT